VLQLASAHAGVFQDLIAAPNEEVAPQQRSEYITLLFDAHLQRLQVNWELGQQVRLQRGDSEQAMGISHSADDMVCLAGSSFCAPNTLECPPTPTPPHPTPPHCHPPTPYTLLHTGPVLPAAGHLL
jgi:hypothetical protein